MLNERFITCITKLLNELDKNKCSKLCLVPTS